MTCRERLEIEHPDKINAGSLGGCVGCPSEYGYTVSHISNCNRGKVSDETCRKCWDREIPNEPEEFEPGKSYAEFMDGHKEEVFYYSMAADGGHILFTTRSGIYFFEDRYEEICMYGRFSDRTRFHPFLRQRYFYRISYDAGGGLLRDSIDYIKTVMIDTRVKHDYCMTLKDGRNVTGSVWVERDASDKQIREAVLNDALAEVMTKTTDA